MFRLSNLYPIRFVVCQTKEKDMFISKPVLACLAAAMLAGAAFAFSFNDPQPLTAEDAKAPVLKIAVVNVAEVIKKMKNRETRQEELDIEMEKLKASISKKTAEAKALAEEVDAMKHDDPDRTEKEQALARLQAETELEFKKGRARLLKRQLRDRRELYGIMRDAVTKYAADNGFALVLKIDDKRIGDNPVTQGRDIDTRTVLYKGSAVTDITDAVIKALNSKAFRR
ncbi:MAG: hypothetical protein DRP79_04775 [Planctomycetota bacterium]|nr:MAG: hypothetical protein DRP79_04775 [Planctomycetota bacterium]